MLHTAFSLIKIGLYRPEVLKTNITMKKRALKNPDLCKQTKKKFKNLSLKSFYLMTAESAFQVFGFLLSICIQRHVYVRIYAHKFMTS